jgi:hypothetical protein
MDTEGKMSATNRGAERAILDDYPTPDWLIEAIIPKVQELKPRRILEPACGRKKAIVNILRRDVPKALVDYFDIVSPWGKDFLATEPEPIYDIIITNPPFVLAQQFIEHALKWRRNDKSAVIILLRINFLGARKRGEWLREHTPSVYVSPRRPGFTLNQYGKPGTDATEYAWMCWNHEPPLVHILHTEDL